MNYDHLIAAVAQAVELAAVGTLVLGALLAVDVFVARFARQRDFPAAYSALRANLGRAVLLGLELLVIADIIGSVAIEPTLPNLAVLGAIVAIRHC